MPKRATIQPYLLVLVGVLGLALIVVAVQGPWQPEPTPRTAEPRASDGIAVTSTASGADPGTVPTSAASLASPTGTPSETPTRMPTKTPTPRPTSTPTPTPLPLSPPVVSSTDAVAYAEGGRLIVVQPADAEVHVVTEDVVYDPGTLRWSPGGRRLLYASAARGAEPGSPEGQRSIQLWDGTTGQTTRLADVLGYPSEGWDIQDTAWSPGGERLLLSGAADTAPGRPAGMWVFDLEASVIRSVSGAEPSSGAWIDDETLLVRKTGEGTLALAHVAGPEVSVTGTLPVEGVHGLSPAGDHVAFLAGQPSGGHKLTAVPLPSFQPLALPEQPAVVATDGRPLWSPDGRWIAYGAMAVPPDREDGAYTLIADTTGKAETRVVAGLLPEAWSPDGRVLAGSGCTGGSCQLSLVDAPSGEKTVLASSGELHVWDLAWSPGGPYLAYSVSGLDGTRTGLVLWNRATGERLRLLEGGTSAPITDVQWMGDGCAIYAAQRKVGTESSDRVSGIWTVGPTWQDGWQLAPDVAGGVPSLAERLKERRRDGQEGLCPDSLLEERRLVAFYGTPLGPGLGILGRYGLSETLELLEDQIQEYRQMDWGVGSDADILPTFHMVTTIADDYPGADGDFNHRVSHNVIRPWIEAVRARGGWAILDIQPGLADLAHELDLLEPLLREPDVHLAVDPEFIISPGEVPGQDLGRITGPQVNYVQARMDQIARETGQRKLVVVHQFDDRMIDRKDLILDYPFVELVWDADGFGGPGSKIADYNQYKRETGFEYGGFKIFYRYDEPVMTPAQVNGLDPLPRLVIYQ